MQKKTYKINDRVFYLKEDLTVEENETIRNLLNNLYSGEDNYSGGIKKFLSMVLIPADTKNSTGEIDFGQTLESVALEVIKDFFLKRMRLTAAMADYFMNLTKEFNLPMTG